jgi:hypothetical protein
MQMRKNNHFKTFTKNKIHFFASIYQSPFDSHQVLDSEDTEGPCYIAQHPGYII